MSLELVNTLATFGTFLVIAATAIAAIVQLRHARSSNQIEALAELREEMENAEMQSAHRFIRQELGERLKDPAFRYQLGNLGALSTENQAPWNQIRRVANCYEEMGILVKAGLADKDLVLDFWSGRTLASWNVLVPVVTLIRQSTANNAVWENFEYLAVLSQGWHDAHPQGAYPPGMRRMKLDYPWLEADKQYAASLAPA
jgi:hypothetical protein